MSCQDVGKMLLGRISPRFTLCFKSKTPPNNTGKKHKLGAKVNKQDLGNKYGALS